MCRLAQNQYTSAVRVAALIGSTHVAPLDLMFLHLGRNSNATAPPILVWMCTLLTAFGARSSLGGDMVANVAAVADYLIFGGSVDCEDDSVQTVGESGPCGEEVEKLARLADAADEISGTSFGTILRQTGNRMCETACAECGSPWLAFTGTCVPVTSFAAVQPQCTPYGIVAIGAQSAVRATEKPSFSPHSLN